MRTLAVLALGCVTIWLYWPVNEFDFVNYDDPIYVSANPQVQQGLTTTGIRAAFSVGYASNWHPLTWISHLLDVQLFGLNPGAHHLVNALGHALNTVLLMLVLLRMTGAFAPSWWVAALFAWHPLHVESVAWISERKDILSTFFWLATLWFYCGYVRRPMNASGKLHFNHNYALALLCFAAGLASKPMLVTLPFVLLLLDVWPLRRVNYSKQEMLRWKPLLLEKVPYFLLSGASSFLTFLAQHQGGAVASLEYVSASRRLLNAVVAYGAYLRKMIWPSDLAVFYPHPGMWPVATVLVSALVLVLATSWIWRQRHARPYLTTGWFWYLGTLVPVIGLVQVGDQAYADRYTYVPLIGLFVGLAWLIRDWAASAAPRQFACKIFAGAVLLVCLGLTREQIQTWKNSETLFRHALAVTTNNYVAHNNLGNTLSRARKSDEARRHYEQALLILPTYEDAHLNLGSHYMERGDLERAANHFRLVIKFKPRSPEGYYNLGTVLAIQQRHEEAVTQYEQALAWRPGHFNAHYNLGITLTKLGRLTDAERRFRQALQLNGQSGFAHYNLGIVLLALNQIDVAQEHLETAIRLAPDYSPARIELAGLFLRQDRLDAAVPLYEAVLASEPKNAQAHNNLGLSLARLGQTKRAANHFTQVVLQEPHNANAHYNLGNALVELGDLTNAAQHYSETIRLDPTDHRAKAKLNRLNPRLFE